MLIKFLTFIVQVSVIKDYRQNYAFKHWTIKRKAVLFDII